MGAKKTLMELIGRVATTGRNWFYGMFPAAVVAYDATRPDYAFWDRLYRGKQATARLGGLFAKPMVEHIRGWALGNGFKAETSHAKTDTALADFVSANLHKIMVGVADAMRLGDAYVIVNADGSLSMASADCVEVITDDLDYTRVMGYRITTRLDKVTIVDEYRRDKRTVTVKEGGVETVTTYKNMTGRLLVTHFAFGKSANEIYGHPIFEALLPLFYEYDDVLDKQLKGVKAMSVPIPAFTGVKNVEKTLTDLGATKTTYVDEDGNTQTGLSFDFQDLPAIFTDGDFKMVGPNPFTDDSWRVLKNLFLLFLQHSNVPEWVWGGAIASSKASVDAQLPAFVKFIESIQLWLAGNLAHLCETWLAVVSLYTPSVRALPVTISYAPVADETDTVVLSKVNFALSNGLVRRSVALGLLDLVPDPAAEVAAADEEAAEMQTQADSIDKWAVNAAAGADDNEDEAA